MSKLLYKIVLAPFPFGDLIAKKTRPVICITEEIGIYNEVIVAYITSKNPTNKVESDLRITSKNQDYLSTGLKKDSTIRFHKVFTIPKSQLIGELGILPKTLQPVADEILKKLLNRKS